MSELTNLTDRLAHLRDRQGGGALSAPEREEPPRRQAPPSRRRLPERRFASDYFMIFVYTLLGVAILTQFLLIGWMDVI